MEPTKTKLWKTPIGFNKSTECEERDFHQILTITKLKKTMNQGRFL